MNAGLNLHVRFTVADNFPNIPKISCSLTVNLKFVSPSGALGETGGNAVPPNY